MAVSALSRSVVARGIAAACALAVALTLGGCGGGHPVTTGGDCASCHSDGRAAAEGVVPDSAVQTGLSFSVESGADEVCLCYAKVSDTDNATVIPASMRTLSADELVEVSVSEPGLYAVCAGPLDSPSAIAVIEAVEGGPEGVSVKL